MLASLLSTLLILRMMTMGSEVEASAVDITFSNFDAGKPWGHNPRHNYSFETVKGFFYQDLDTTDTSTFDFLSTNFGLISTAPLHWQSFDWTISQLNKHAPKDVSYRVFFMGRHGEGYHNVAEAFYGTAAWDDYWSKLNTDGNITWGPDAFLTPKGVGQAQAIAAAWKAQIADGAPAPTSFYSSPLTRSADTLNYTFAETLGVGSKKGPSPVFLEGLRETIGVHTCDERHSKSWIAAREPRWAFEAGFAEEDPFWTPDYRETDGERLARVRAALVKIVDNDGATYVSITAHGGAITAAFQALGHRAFSLQTGGMIPVVAKVTRLS